MTTDDWLSVSNTHRHSDVCWFSSLLLCSRLCCVLFSSALICFFSVSCLYLFLCSVFFSLFLYCSLPLPSVLFCSVLIRSFIVAFYPPLFPFFSCVPSCSPLFPCVPFCSLSFCSRLFLSLLCCSLLFHCSPLLFFLLPSLLSPLVLFWFFLLSFTVLLVILGSLLFSTILYCL